MVVVLDQFLRNLRESRLIPAEEVVSLQKALQASKTPQTVEDVAKLLVQSGKLTMYQAITINQGRPESLVLGEYVLLDVLGKGGMGVVFRARHRLMDRVVALKTLSLTAIKPDTVQRFYREVKAAARLSHPNIVTAYDAGECGGTHYLVMEYVVGRDLSAVVKERGPLPLRQAIDYTQQAARGLDYAHKHGVVHRDVKPSNLLLDKEGVVKILDMGLARLNENLADAPEAMELTGTGQILGTVDYMSPEQAEDVRLADQRSDIYSLGCTLFYLLTRRAAFGGETIVKRILSHREDPIPSVMDLRPDCPNALDAAIQRMLAKRPEDRPQTMAEIIVQLESCLATPDAAPPLAGPLPESRAAEQNWLENLVSEDATPNTDNLQAQIATLGAPTEGEFDLGSPKASTSSSSVSRSKRRAKRSGARKSASAASRGRFLRLAIALTMVAAIAAVAVWALVLKQPNFNMTPAKLNGDGGLEPDSGKPSSSGVTAPAPNPPNQRPAWEEAWIDTKGRADRLVAKRQFAGAIREYSTLAGRYPDPQLKKRCDEAIQRIEAEADSALRQVETAARQHLRQQQFGPARAVLQAALAEFGPVPTAVRARKLIEEIDQAEKHAAQQRTRVPKVPEAPTLSPELLKRRQLDAMFAKATASAEGQATIWDFRAALQELDKLHFDAPELTSRLTERREQVRRLADLKDRFMAMINQADPPLQKSDLVLRGINGEVNKADAEGIATTLPNGKQESIAWPDLGPKAMHKMLTLVVRREDAGDWLAAGMLSLVGQDVQSAERYFEKARSLGADTTPYMALLAAQDFANIRDLLAKHKFAESKPLLTTLKEKYGTIPWFTANKPEFDAAENEMGRGLHEEEAEALYAQAAGLFRNDDCYELKPLVVRLKSQYGDSAVAADPQRKPSLAEMEKAVADLGPLVRVRKDGQGDAKTIQEAVDHAPRNALIRIEEVGPWSEQIAIPLDKSGLTISGKKGLLPVVTTAGAKNTYAEAFSIQSPQFSLERLVVVRADSGGPLGTAITADRTSLSLRGVVVVGHMQAGSLNVQQSVCAASVRVQQGVVAKNSVFFGRLDVRGACSFQNVLHCGGALNCGPDSELRHCTNPGPVHLSGLSGKVSDCIVQSISALNDGHTIEYCDVFGENPFLNHAAAGKGCLKALPQFADAKTLDFRLQPTSPCRKAASDGSDMGFAYTAEIQALLKVAADLRNRARGKL